MAGRNYYQEPLLGQAPQRQGLTLNTFNPFNGSQPSYTQLPPQQSTAYHNGALDPSDDNPKHYVSDRKKISTFSKLKRYVSLIIAVSKAFSAVFSLLMEVAMGYVMQRFYATRNIAAGDRSGPWHDNTKLWPTILLSVASGITLTLTLGSLLILCCSKKAQKNNRKWLTVLKYFIHIGVWAGVSAFYRIGKTGNDLWGWSCSEEADAIQYLYNDHLNFGFLCNLQV